MQHKVLRALVAFFVVLGLMFGQATAGLAMGVPMNMEQPSIMANMSGQNDTTSVSNGEHEDGCCTTHADKNHTMKAGTCGACCVAACQAVVMPSRFAAPALYAATQIYSMMDASVVGKDVLPEPPYPKA
jgi:hypothetical protein